MYINCFGSLCLAGPALLRLWLVAFILYTWLKLLLTKRLAWNCSSQATVPCLLHRCKPRNTRKSLNIKGGNNTLTSWFLERDSTVNSSRPTHVLSSLVFSSRLPGLQKSLSFCSRGIMRQSAERHRFYHLLPSNGFMDVFSSKYQGHRITEVFSTEHQDHKAVKATIVRKSVCVCACVCVCVCEQVHSTIAPLTSQ